jgi:hypothetical protein
MRVALADQSLGLKITNKVETSTRAKIPAKYITDLDFADDIMLITDDAINSQKQLDSKDIIQQIIRLMMIKLIHQLIGLIVFKSFRCQT